MLNRIVIMGRLTRDPELRRTQNGTAVTSFSVAVDRDFKSRESGEKATDFILSLIHISEPTRLRAPRLRLSR